MSPNTAKLRAMVARIRSERPLKRHDPYRGLGPFLTGSELDGYVKSLPVNDRPGARKALEGKVRRAGYTLDYRLPPKSDPLYRTLRNAARIAVWGQP